MHCILYNIDSQNQEESEIQSDLFKVAKRKKKKQKKQNKTDLNSVASPSPRVGKP